MLFETENLALDEDGGVWLRFEDDDGERDIERIGRVDDAELDDDDLHGEFLAVQRAWEEMICDRRNYEAGMGSYWGR